MRDNRWNTTAFLLLRISQLLLGVIALGISAYFESRYESQKYPPPSTPTPSQTIFNRKNSFIILILALGILTLVWVIVALTLFFTNKLHPLAAIIVDVILAICYIASIATVASTYPGVIGNSCKAYAPSRDGMDDMVIKDCAMLNGGFAILVTNKVLRQNRNGKRGDARAVVRNAMHCGGVGGGQMALIGGAYELLGPTMDPENGSRGSGGNQGAQTFMSQYHPRNSPIYPAQVASPATLHNPYVPPPSLLAMPQQALMMQHPQHQNHRNHHRHQLHHLHHLQQQQQRQHQLQSQHQHQHQQYQQNRESPPQELGGTY
ncbi:unnamed protein product [Tuber aestivum]|uniref:MARVEL domain-containing protein n=1 Tax=Tuber aestivum TaxID=59557 RepID=A0A292Q594_9PEZI|nr:unnamed protein product [Tuber aestivum]